MNGTLAMSSETYLRGQSERLPQKPPARHVSCCGGQWPEPPRLSRRLQSLRGWSHDKTEPVLTGSADAGSADGFGARSGARLTVGGHHLDRREDRLYRRDAPEVGPADGA